MGRLSVQSLLKQADLRIRFTGDAFALTAADNDPYAAEPGGSGERVAHSDGAAPAGEPVGLLWTWWRGDPVPALAPLPGFVTGPAGASRAATALLRRTPDELRALGEAGNRPYAASMYGVAVAYGWAASGAASFGTPSTPFRVPDGNRYLWEFFTLPAWRGRGLYPRLLQAILAAEGDAQRFWILHRPANAASARGIARAGFGSVGTIRQLRAGGFGLAPAGLPPRAEAAAGVFGLSLLAAGEPPPSSVRR